MAEGGSTNYTSGNSIVCSAHVLAINTDALLYSGSAKERKTRPDALQRLITAFVRHHICTRQTRVQHFVRHLFNLTALRQMQPKLACRTEWSHELLLTLRSDLWWTVIQEYHIKPNQSCKALLSPRLWAGPSELIKGKLKAFKRLRGLRGYGNS